MESASKDKGTKTVRVEIDGEDYEVEGRERTARELLALAGLDPATTYLVELRGSHQESYRDRAEEPIKLHPHMRFLTADIGSAPVA